MSEKYLDLTGLGHFLEKLDTRYARSSDIPSTYIKSASVSGNTLTLTKQDDSTQTFTPTFTDTNYYPTAVSWTNGGASGPTGTITMSGTSNISIPAVPAASASYSGIVTTGGQTFAGNKGFNGSVVLNNGGTFYKPIYLGAGIPSKGDGSTAYFGEDLIMNRRTGAVSGFYAESSQWNRFLGLHMNPAYICTCNYKGDGTATAATSTDGLWKASQSGDNTQWSGYLGYLFNSNFTTGATFPVANLSTNPIVITVKSATGTRIDATDTDYVELNGWRYEGYQGTSTNYYGKLTSYKLEILTDYENDTWVKTFERTSVEDNVNSIKFPVWSSVGGSASYTNFYGIRLTISGAVAGSSGYLGLTELKLMETRPAGAPADGVGAISQLGGNLYGNITLPSKNGSGKYTEIKISPSDSDNYNYLGESSKQWYRVYAKGFYRNGTEISSLYVPQTRTVNGKALTADITLSASDVSALPSSTTYLASASVSGNTLTITPSSGSAISYTPSFTDYNFYPYRSYTSGLQISTGMGSTNCELYVPVANGTSQSGVVSTSAQTFAGVKSFNDGIKLLETGSYYATVQGDSSASSNITLTLPKSTGQLALIDDLPSGEVDVTINGTATQTTEALVNIIVGTTTYTKPTYSLNGSRTTSGSGTTARRTLTISVS